MEKKIKDPVSDVRTGLYIFRARLISLTCIQLVATLIKSIYNVNKHFGDGGDETASLRLQHQSSLFFDRDSDKTDTELWESFLQQQEDIKKTKSLLSASSEFSDYQQLAQSTPFPGNLLSLDLDLEFLPQQIVDWLECGDDQQRSAVAKEFLESLREMRGCCFVYSAKVSYAV